MTKDELHDEHGSFRAHVVPWLRGRMKAGAGEPHHAPNRVRLKPSPRMSEAQATAEMEICLQEIINTRAIDVAALVEGAKRELAENRRRRSIVRKKFYAAAASLLVVVGLMLLYAYAGTYTSYDAPRLVSLKDGSQVELNAHSAIEVRFTESARELRLKKGQAIFKVRPNANRPFRVHAGSALIEAVGTQFDVRLTDDHAVITMVEGVCQLKPVPSSSPAKQAEPLPRITAGFSLIVDPEGRAGTAVPVDAFAITSWRKHVGLVFDNATLAEIAEAFNHRHAKPKLIIEGEALRARRFVISFSTPNSEELVKYLKRDESLMFISTSDEVVIRERDR